jgi:hypothetical protein
MVKILSSQKKFAFLFLLLILTTSLTLGSTAPADAVGASFFYDSWESDEIEIDMNEYGVYVGYSSISFGGTTYGSFQGWSFVTNMSGILPDYFFENIEYGDSSISFLYHDNWDDTNKSGTMRYRIIDNDTVEFEVILGDINLGYLRHRRVDYNETGDVSLSSGVGCNNGGLLTVFGGLIALLVGYRKKD